MSAVPIPGPAPRTEEWHSLRIYDPQRKERPVIFFATEAAAALNQSPYDDPFSLFLKKRGQIAETATTDAMRRGLKLETFVLDEFEDTTCKRLIRDCSCYLSGQHAFMGATPDAIVDPGEAAWAEGVDAKTTTFRMVDRSGGDVDKFGAHDSDQVPRYVLFQVQQQMAVLGLQRVYVPLMIDRDTFPIYRIDRSDELIEAIVSAERELAERIINNDPPEPNWEGERTRSLLRQYYGFSSGKRVELSSEARTMWLDYQRAGDQIKQLETRRRAVANRVLAELKDAEAGTFPNGQKEIARIAVGASSYTVTRQPHEQLRERKVKR
jgi:predicted phage-related endonuclease